MTITQTTLGTAAYMAPEQLENHQVGTEADVWSLGIVLLECLTGRRVYEGPPTEVIARRLAGPVPVPAGLPAPWRVVLTGMFDHRPERRLTAAEVASLLSTSALERPSEVDTAVMTAPFTEVAQVDLRSLAPSAALSSPVASAPFTAVTPVEAFPVTPVPSSPWRQVDRRLRVGLIAGGILAGVVVLGLLANTVFGSGGPAVAATTTTVRHPPTTVRSTTTTTAPRPTTTLPLTPGQAVGVLDSDVGKAEAVGGIDPGTANTFETGADQAVSDGAAGNTTQTFNDLQQAATALASGASAGKVTPAADLTLQADLEKLATALSLPGAANVTTTTTTTGPPPPPKHKHGGGDGGPGGGGG